MAEILLLLWTRETVVGVDGMAAHLVKAQDLEQQVMQAADLALF